MTQSHNKTSSSLPSPDGQHFLVNMLAPAVQPTLSVIPNWTEELTRLLRTKLR